MLRPSIPKEFCEDLSHSASASTLITALKENLERTEPFKIRVDPRSGLVPKRASVAIILSLQPKISVGNIEHSSNSSLDEFLNQNWVKDAQIEFLFIKRAKRNGDRWSGHVGFPGGRQNQGETDRETAERETMEEIGVNLKSMNFSFLGELDDKVVTHWMSDNVTLVLSGFVYVHLRPTPISVKLDEKEVAAVFTVPFGSFLFAMRQKEHLFSNSVTVPVFRYSASKWKTYFGKLHYPAIEVAYDNAQFAHYPSVEWRIWGITFRLTSDVIDLMMLETDRTRYLSLSANNIRWNNFWYDVDWLLNNIFLPPLNSIGRRSGREVFQRRPTWPTASKLALAISIATKALVSYWLARKFVAKL